MTSKQLRAKVRTCRMHRAILNEAIPAIWQWCGDDELTGNRSRYRILALERMIESLELPSLDAFQRLYRDGINAQIARRQLAREAVWSEALAIGDRAFVERIAGRFGYRSRFTYGDAGPSLSGATCVYEALPGLRGDYSIHFVRERSGTRRTPPQAVKRVE